MRDQSPNFRFAKAGLIMRWLTASPSAAAAFGGLKIRNAAVFSSVAMVVSRRRSIRISRSAGHLGSRRMAGLSHLPQAADDLFTIARRKNYGRAVTGEQRGPGLLAIGAEGVSAAGREVHGATGRRAGAVANADRLAGKRALEALRHRERRDRFA